MSKKLILSLSIIGLVAAIVVGGTIAYFSDTETSTGNTFTAGAIDLTIDNESYYNGVLSEETSWEANDLTDQVFFNFSDLKPGDWGEDTVSLHVNNNNSWGCVTFENMVDDDNGCTEPEEEDGDQTCGDKEGELSGELYFAFWADTCRRLGSNHPVVIAPALPGDNVYQPECDRLLTQGLASDILPGTTYTLAAPGALNVFTGEEGAPLIGGDDYYIGKIWCYGELILDGEEWVCDGRLVDNMSQTDSLTGDISFYVEQSRNNDQFTCVQPETTTVQSSVFNFSATGWAGWSCPSSHPNIVTADTTNCALSLGVSEAAKPGSSLYPDYPHYSYPAGEEGWAVQNGGTSQSCYIVLTCQAD